MENIETVTLDGAELKVEGLGGQNTIIINRGSENLYASAYVNVVADGDNVALILPGGAMNLRGTNGTVYLLGTGKVQLEGTDTADLPIALGGVSGGGGSAGVSQEYVDNADATTLKLSKDYTDDQIQNVESQIPIVETLTTEELNEMLNEVFGPLIIPMPIMKGINAYYTPATLIEGTSKWSPSKSSSPDIDITGNYSIVDNGLHLDQTLSSDVSFTELPKMIYLCLKTMTKASIIIFGNSRSGLINREPTYCTVQYVHDSVFGANLAFIPFNQLYIIGIRFNTDSNIDIFINGEFKANRDMKNLPPSIRLNYTYSYSSIPQGDHIVYSMAVGNEKHTNEEILENSNWLLNQYSNS